MRVRINTHGLETPKAFDEWVDLVTAEAVALRPFEYKLISLGVSIELPVGYEAIMLPRTTTFEKFGILLASGAVCYKNSFKGDGDIWHFPAVALRETFIPAGTRICQFRLIKCGELIEFEQVDRLGNKDRSGWGSTG